MVQNIGDIVGITAPLVVAFVISIMTRRYFSSLIKKYLVKENKGKETVFRLLERVIIAFVFMVAIFASVSKLYPGLGNFLSSALLAAGFLAIIVGLAAQRTLGNVFAGLNIALTRPIRIGDAVIIRNEYGTVEDITLRHTVIKTWDNRRMMIPNSVLDEEVVVNYTIRDEKKLFGIVMHVPSNTDLEKAGRIMVAEAKHHPNVLKELNPIFQVLDFEEKSVMLRLLFLAKDQPTAFNTAVELRSSMAKQFRKQRIKFSISSMSIERG